MSIRIGLDIGATKTKIIMITQKGEIMARARIVTASDGVPGPIVEKSAGAIEQMLQGCGIKPSRVEAMSVGICGFLNPETGIIDISPNLHWHNVPFKKLMERRLGRTVYMSNDVSAAAWGEFVYGAGRGSRDMAILLIGSGIGGGIVANGRLVEGGTGSAGEAGHMTFKKNGLKCECGRRGCFEAYGGGMPLERRMARAARRGLSPLVLKMVKGDIGRINTRIIRRAAKAGDPAAGRIWAEAEASLGILCADLTSLLNPDRLVIGGGVLEGNPGLLKVIKDTVRSNAVTTCARHVKIVKSELGDDAVAMGAAALVDLYSRV